MLDGRVADLLVVSARTSRNVRDADGITLFVIPPDAAGVAIHRQARLDGRNAAIVRAEPNLTEPLAEVEAPPYSEVIVPAQEPLPAVIDQLSLFGASLGAASSRKRALRRSAPAVLPGDKQLILF